MAISIDKLHKPLDESYRKLFRELLSQTDLEEIAQQSGKVYRTVRYILITGENNISTRNIDVVKIAVEKVLQNINDAESILNELK